MRKFWAAVTITMMCGGAGAALADGESYPLAGAFDRVPAQSEYYGHFLHGKIHHGPAVHGGGHLNANALFSKPKTSIHSAKGRAFTVLVAPNLVNRAAAQHAASTAAIAHCAGVSAAKDPVFVGVQRHSALDLSSWAFQGRCR